jgi:hypothetical protein
MVNMNIMDKKSRIVYNINEQYDKKRQNNYVNITTGYWMDDQGSIHSRVRDIYFSVFRRMYTETRTHSVQYPTETEIYVSLGKLAGP